MFWYVYADRMYAGSKSNEPKLMQNMNEWNMLWWKKVSFKGYSKYRYYLMYNEERW